MLYVAYNNTQEKKNRSSILKTYAFFYFQLTDILFAELPRIRLDWVHRPIKHTFETHPILHEVPEEECEKYAEMHEQTDHDHDKHRQKQQQQQQQIQYHLELNTTIGSALGKTFYFFVFY